MNTRLPILLIAAAVPALAQPSIRQSEGVLNAASFTAPVAPGGLLSIFGTSLASSMAAADTIPLSTSLSGVTVEFVQGSNNYPAPLLFVYQGDPNQNAPAQVNAQLPWEIDPNGPAVSVTVTSNGATSNQASVPVAALAPGIFASNGFAIAVNNSDQTLAWPAGAVPGVTTHAAKAGDVLVIYATGLGALDNSIPDGQAPSYFDNQLRNTTTPPTVLVGGIQAQVIYSVLSPQFVGVNQLAIFVPSGVASGNNVPLQIQEGGVTTPASATIAISQ
jgi:uncharacterized protein (TIGR03437 family)